MKNLLPAINPLLQRVVAFLILFLLISGTVGPGIINNKALLHGGFELYGGLGKAMIFGVIAFAILARRTKASVTLKPWQPTQLLWLGVSAIVFILAIMSLGRLSAGSGQMYDLLIAHAGLMLCVGFSGVACFGLDNLKLLWQAYKKQLIYALYIAVGFYIFLQITYALWQPLAGVVLYSVMNMLRSCGLDVILVQPHTLMLDKFGITIAEYCSGIESIALFTSLYAIVGILDWERLNKKRYFLVYPFALFALCLLNILRVYGLIMAGYYINPEIAFSLFHTYAGMVFFIIYSAIFWAFAYKYLVGSGKPHAKDVK